MVAEEDAETRARADVTAHHTADSIAESTAESTAAGTADGTADNAADNAVDAAGDVDRWRHFAEASPDSSQPPPGRARRLVRGLGRAVRHEWTLAVAVGLGLAVAVTWPTLADPTRTIPQDTGDPLLQAWQVAWAGHSLLTDPAGLWHANTFYPEPNSYAFSDSLLGYAPFGMIGSGPEAAVLRYNILFVLAHALAFIGGYALLRQLGARWAGAAVAGAAFAFAPWRLAHGGHLNILSTGGIALALAMLARGHGWSLRHGYRPERVRPGWALAGWLVASWQITLGFGLGLSFAYVLLLIGVIGAAGWLVCLLRRRRRRFSGWLLQTDLAGGLLLVAVTVGMALPYLRVRADYPQSRRTVEELTWYSPGLRGFLTSPGESLLWGRAHAPARAAMDFPVEMAVLPGMALIGFALAGLFLSIWTVRQRLLLALGVAVTVMLAMGPNGLGAYLLLYHHAPGWDGIRTPGRLVLWTTLLLGVLAAGAVSGFRERAQQVAETAHVDDRVAARPAWPLRLALLVPVLLVLAEGLNTTPHPTVPKQPAAMREVAGPVLVLPSGAGRDTKVMLWSTDGFPRVVNGTSGFNPPKLDEIRKRSENFPDPASVAYLRRIGVKTVVVLRSEVAGTPWQNVPDARVEGLRITRREAGDAVVFTIR